MIPKKTEIEGKETPPNLPQGEASQSPSFGGVGEVEKIQPDFPRGMLLA